MGPGLTDCFRVIVPLSSSSPPPFSFPGREQCGAELMGACTLSVFHLSSLPWELAHAVDRKQHLAGLRGGNNKSDISSPIFWQYSLHAYPGDSQPRSLPFCSHFIAFLMEMFSPFIWGSFEGINWWESMKMLPGFWIYKLILSGALKECYW